MDDSAGVAAPSLYVSHSDDSGALWKPLPMFEPKGNAIFLGDVNGIVFHELGTSGEREVHRCNQDLQCTSEKWSASEAQVLDQPEVVLLSYQLKMGDYLFTAENGRIIRQHDPSSTQLTVWTAKE